MATKDDEIRQNVAGMFAARDTAQPLASAQPATPAPQSRTSQPDTGRRLTSGGLVPVSCYVEPAELAALEAAALAADRSVSYVIRQAIRQHLGIV